MTAYLKQKRLEQDVKDADGEIFGIIHGGDPEGSDAAELKVAFRRRTEARKSSGLSEDCIWMLEKTIVYPHYRCKKSQEQGTQSCRCSCHHEEITP